MSGIKLDSTALKCKIIQIGDWNMDTTADKYVAHGLTQSNIRLAFALIRQDDDAESWPIDSDFTGAGSSGGIGVQVTNIHLYAIPGKGFDSTTFDATSYNRGWVMIWYEP